MSNGIPKDQPVERKRHAVVEDRICKKWGCMCVHAIHLSYLFWCMEACCKQTFPYWCLFCDWASQKEIMAIAW